MGFDTTDDQETGGASGTTSWPPQPPSQIPAPHPPPPSPDSVSAPPTDYRIVPGLRPRSGLRPESQSDSQVANPMATGIPRQPGRFLDPNLAAAVARAKKRSGMTWRTIARRVGVSHSHLINISKGRRLPSSRTVEGMARVLRIDGDELEGLREVASERLIDLTRMEAHDPVEKEMSP